MRSNNPCLTCPHIGPTPTIGFFEANGISRAELARLLGVSASAVTRWAQRGIPCWHLDSLRRLQIQVLHSRPEAYVPPIRVMEVRDDLDDL